MSLFYCYASVPLYSQMSGFVIPNFHKMCFNPTPGKVGEPKYTVLKAFWCRELFFEGDSLDSLTGEDTSLSLYSLKGF